MARSPARIENNEHPEETSGTFRTYDKDRAREHKYTRTCYQRAEKIGCQPEINNEGHVTFKYQGDDFYIAAEEENRFIMIWNPWWGSINTDNEAFPYLKEIINLVNVNSLVTTVFMVDEDEKTVGIHSHCHTFSHPTKVNWKTT